MFTIGNKPQGLKKQKEKNRCMHKQRLKERNTRCMVFWNVKVSFYVLVLLQSTLLHLWGKSSSIGLVETNSKKQSLKSSKYAWKCKMDARNVLHFQCICGEVISKQICLKMQNGCKKCVAFSMHLWWSYMEANMLENAKWMQEMCFAFLMHLWWSYIDSKMNNFSSMGQRYMDGNGSKSIKFNNL
jgi:hypothetical protein